MPYEKPVPRQEPMGPPKCFDVSLPACHSLRTPADLHILAISGCFVLASGALKPWPSTTSAFRSCSNFQGTRLPLRPTGFSVYASPVLFGYSPSCLRHRRNTRYGWVASPCPAGTCTQQDTPSLAWRDNAGAQGRAALRRVPCSGLLCGILLHVATGTFDPKAVARAKIASGSPAMLLGPTRRTADRKRIRQGG